jgi:hypothetical protein
LSASDFVEANRVIATFGPLQGLGGLAPAVGDCAERCRATTNRGTRCAGRRLPGRDVCWRHEKGPKPEVGDAGLIGAQQAGVLRWAGYWELRLVNHEAVR